MQSVWIGNRATINRITNEISSILLECPVGKAIHFERKPSHQYQLTHIHTVMDSSTVIITVLPFETLVTHIRSLCLHSQRSPWNLFGFRKFIEKFRPKTVSWQCAMNFINYQYWLWISDESYFNGKIYAVWISNHHSPQKSCFQYQIPSSFPNCTLFFELCHIFFSIGPYFFKIVPLFLFCKSSAVFLLHCVNHNQAKELQFTIHISSYSKNIAHCCMSQQENNLYERIDFQFKPNSQLFPLSSLVLYLFVAKNCHFQHGTLHKMRYIFSIQCFWCEQFFFCSPSCAFMEFFFLLLKWKKKIAARCCNNIYGWLGIDRANTKNVCTEMKKNEWERER